MSVKMLAICDHCGQQEPARERLETMDQIPIGWYTTVKRIDSYTVRTENYCSGACVIAALQNPQP